jgi:aminomethyltransferase
MDRIGIAPKHHCRTVAEVDVSEVEAEPELAEMLPLDGWHRTRGARMVPFAGYAMPIQYEGIIAEHLWTRESAGLFDVSHMGQLLVSGDKADKALEAVLPGDIVGLGRDRIRYSLLLGEEGGILDDLMVTRRGDGLYVVVNGATKYDDIAYLHEMLPDTVTLNHMDEQALLALQGPKAVDALARVAPGVEALTFMTAGAFTIDGVKAWISRSGYTGEDGFEISIPQEAATQIAGLLADQPEVKPIGLGARDSLRLEAGLPLYGHDLDPETTPVSADLGFALSKRRREEGGFAGADRVLAEYRDGAATKRVGLMVEGRQPVREGAVVVGGGRVTSGGFSPSLQRPIAMAFVPAASSAPGTVLSIEQRGKIFQATVTPMPFVPHRYHRKGSAL